MSIYTFDAKRVRHGTKQLQHGAKRTRTWGETTKDVGQNNLGETTMGQNDLLPLQILGIFWYFSCV